MTLVSWRGMGPWNSNGKIGSGGAEYERGMKKRHFSHCRYCIPIHQAALLSRADPGVSRAFLYALRSQTMPLAVHCATCAFNSNSHIPDCEVILAVLYFTAFCGWTIHPTAKVSEAVDRKLPARNTTFNRLYTDPWTPQHCRRTDDITMPRADHTAFCYCCRIGQKSTQMTEVGSRPKQWH